MQIKQCYQKAIETLQIFSDNEKNILATDLIIKGLIVAFKQGKKILACGNGGSTCDAMHLCEEFTAQYRQYRRALPAIALCDPAHITCSGNDFGFEEIFSRGVEAYGQPGDWLVALSTSGNSKNIIRAIDTAKNHQMKTFALLGKNGGKLKGICDYEMVVQAETSDRIQEVHMTILHIIIEGVERGLFPENY
jgi:D-sedoheptulose 7-phosphate isomerase